MYLSRILKDLTNKSKIASEHTTFCYFLLCLPFIWSGISQRIFDITDLYWIGRLGRDAINAASVSSSLGMLVFFLCFLVSNGAQVPLAQAYKSNKDEYQSLRSTSFYLIILLSILLTVPLFIFAGPLLELTVNGKTLSHDSILFLRVFTLGLPLQMYFNYFSRVLAIERNMTYVNRSRLYSLFLNFILDPLLIFGFSIIPRVGVTGAAVATVITKVWSAWYISRNYHGAILPNHPFRIRIAKEILELGLPTTLLALAKPIVGIMYVHIFATLSTDALAAYNISNRVFNIVFLFTTGIDIALTTEFAHLYMDKTDNINETNAIRSGLEVAIIFLVIFALAVLLFAKPIAMAFSHEANFSDLTAEFLALRLLAVPGLVLTAVYQAALKAQRKSKVAMLTGLIPISATIVILVLGKDRLTAPAAFIVIAASMTMEGLLSFFFFRFSSCIVQTAKRLTFSLS